jgi:DNA-binding NtrC family response regulator
MQHCILAVDDDPNALFGLTQILIDEGFKVISASNGLEALKVLKNNSINIVITDERMPDLSGLDLLTKIKAFDSDIPVILLTAFGSVPLAVEALKHGAYYFFEKPIFNNLEQFITIIRQALKTQEMERELDHLRKEVIDKYSFPNIIGKHPSIYEVFEIIDKVAQTDKTVLIQGESGTGKDLIAKTIHYNSLRKNKPFIVVNCGALTETLMTTELFGHTRGAFTGAVKDTLGRFQMANGGTLSLEEIGEIPVHLQKTLLRVLEEKELEQVGSSQSIKVDVRIISTTNRNLREEVRKGNFREDLFYRLSIVPLIIPPLRERVSDIPLLIKHFLKKFQEKDSPISIDPEVVEYLKRYPWHGNVRELANVVQNMMLFCKGNTITVRELPPHILTEGEQGEQPKKGKIALGEMVSDLEKKYIVGKLKESNWNRERAALLLGITRKKLISRMAKYKIQVPKDKLIE